MTTKRPLEDGDELEVPNGRANRVRLDNEVEAKEQAVNVNTNSAELSSVSPIVPFVGNGDADDASVAVSDNDDDDDDDNDNDENVASADNAQGSGQMHSFVAEPSTTVSASALGLDMSMHDDSRQSSTEAFEDGENSGGYNNGTPSATATTVTTPGGRSSGGSGGGSSSVKTGNKWPRPCDVEGCGKMIKSDNDLMHHRRSHKTEYTMKCAGVDVVFARESIDVPWPCPVDGCLAKTFKSTISLENHFRDAHVKKVENDDQQSAAVAAAAAAQNQIVRHETPTIARATPSNSNSNIGSNSIGGNSGSGSGSGTQTRISTSAGDGGALTGNGYLQLDIGGVDCGYHLATGAFICNVCRVVPECLLTHLREKHQPDDEAVISNDQIPTEAVNAGYDPNGNQHEHNPNLKLNIDLATGRFITNHIDVMSGFSCCSCTFATTEKSSTYAHSSLHHRGQPTAYRRSIVVKIKPMGRGYLYYTHSFIDGANNSASVANTASSSSTTPNVKVLRFSTPGSMTPTSALNESPRLSAAATSSATKSHSAGNTITPTRSHQSLPQPMPRLENGRQISLSGSSSARFNAVCSAVDRMLADATALLNGVTCGYTCSAGLQLSSSTPSDLGYNVPGYGIHMSTACDEEVRQYVGHLERAAPLVHAALSDETASASSPEYRTLVDGHDSLLQLIILLLVVTGGSLSMNEAELASINVIDLDKPRNISLFHGLAVLITTSASSSSTTATAIRVLPHPVSQLLLDFLTLVRRPLVDSLLLKGSMLQVHLLKALLCSSATSASLQTVTATSALDQLSEKYFGAKVTLYELKGILHDVSAQLGHQNRQVTPNSMPSLYEFGTAFESARQWHEILVNHGASSLQQ
ncbi:hypothetical protein GQ42DRAFT_8514 [Ramicandelaber brevisporus]|nr:hypothetical protein GQ42DRAFT_8514 [Ramicandelaber brevisporus]